VLTGVTDQTEIGWQRSTARCRSSSCPLQANAIRWGWVSNREEGSSSDDSTTAEPLFELPRARVFRRQDCRAGARSLRASRCVVRGGHGPSSPEARRAAPALELPAQFRCDAVRSTHSLARCASRRVERARPSEHGGFAARPHDARILAGRAIRAQPGAVPGPTLTGSGVRVLCRRGQHRQWAVMGAAGSSPGISSRSLSSPP
jgi:hypothetical protein